MKIVVQKSSPLGLREQIKRQIRMLIESSALQPGQALPSARDLSAILQVNRNTITQAYKELASEGILDIRVGSGTFVKKNLAVKSKTALDELFDQVIENAKQVGFRTDEIAEHFLNRLSVLTATHPTRKVVVVDCNDEVIQYLCHKIEEECGAPTQGVLIQELEMDPTAAVTLLEGSHLVVCGLNHMQELERAVPSLSVEVVGVLLQVDAKVINRLARLPPETTVGYVCANQRSTETLYNSAYFSGGRELRRILAGYDNSKKLKQLLQECDVIFVTHFIFERLQKLVRPHHKLIRVNISVDSSSMDLIRERLYP